METSELFHDAASIDYPILDCDAHVNEPPDTWTARVPAKLRDRAPKVLHRDDGDYWSFDDGASIRPVGLTAGSRALVRVVVTRRLQPQLAWMVVLAMVAAGLAVAQTGLAWGDRQRVPAQPHRAGRRTQRGTAAETGAAFETVAQQASASHAGTMGRP